MYHWTGSLYPGLAMHALFNSVSVASVVEAWQLPVVIVLSIAVTLTIAHVIARGLGERAVVIMGVGEGDDRRPTRPDGRAPGRHGQAVRAPSGPTTRAS